MFPLVVPAEGPGYLSQLAENKKIEKVNVTMIRKKNAKCITGFRVIASERSNNGLSSNSLLCHHFSRPAQLFQGLFLNREKRSILCLAIF